MNLNTNGIIGTTVFHLIIIFILIFFGFSYPDPPPEEEGILVNFGTDDTGLGDLEPSGGQGEEETVSEPADPIQEEVMEESIPQPQTEQANVQEDVQDYEESPVVENKPTPEEIRQQELERQRQEELRRQREEEEKKRQQAEKLKKMGETAFGNRGAGTESGSEGVEGGEGNQGTSTGTPGADNYGEGGGLGDGNYGLGNRKARGQLPKPIVDGCVVTNRIVVRVQIDVDSEGNVVGTPRVLEATYQDDCIYEAVIKAAKRAKFSADPSQYRQRGWIRYIIEP